MVIEVEMTVWIRRVGLYGSEKVKDQDVDEAMRDDEVSGRWSGEEESTWWRWKQTRI